MTATQTRPHFLLRLLSAIALLAAGGIHAFLIIFDGVGGVLGVLFGLNGAAGIVLGIAMLTTRGARLRLVSVLGLLFLVASVASLVLALTVGLFGIRTSWDYFLARETLIIEAIGVVVLLITTIALAGNRRAS